MEVDNIFEGSPPQTVLFNIILQILKSFPIVLFDSQHSIRLALGNLILLQIKRWDPRC